MTVLQWQRNETNIGGAFSSISSEGNIQQVDSFTLILDSITTRDIVANMTSRLVTNISNLISGDRITCGAVNMLDTRTLNYVLSMPHKIWTINHPKALLLHFPTEWPPAVPIDFSVSIESGSTTVDITIVWDSAFNLVHNVSSYRVVASGGSAASCPSSCDLSGPCKCTGLGIGEDTTITITAINCGNQMGPPVKITARPQGNHTKPLWYQAST